MPRAVHQADSWLRPAGALVQAKGEPLSTRMTAGKPQLSNRRSKAGLTTSALVEPSICKQSTYRLNASRTVRGSKRLRSLVRHQPLKSTVHTSLGAWTTSRSCSRATTRRRRLGLRTRGSPARSKIRATVLTLGTPLPISAESNCLSFLAPHGYRRRNSIRRRTTSPSVLETFLGRLLHSSSPASPTASKRRIHLYPLFRLIPYSRHS